MGKDLKGKELGKNLYQRKDGRYEAKYTDNFGKRHSFYGKKLADVRRMLNNALYKKEHSIFSENARFTLNEWFEIWIDTYKKNIVKQSTLGLTCYKYHCYIEDEIGFMMLKDIKPIHIQNIIEKLYNKNLTKETIKHIIGILNNMFYYAVKNKYISDNPCSCIILKSKKEKEDIKVLTIKEERLFLDAAKGTYFYNFYKFLLVTGLRAGEAIALTWDDIRLEEKMIYVKKTAGFAKDPFTLKDTFYLQKPKTKNSIRSVPINNVCFEILMELKKADKSNNTGNLIFTNKNGGYIRNSVINRSIKRITDKIPMRRFSAHCFRHTFATRCFEAGISPKVVQDILGHSSLKMTMDLYTHIEDNLKIKEMEKFNQIFQE